MKIDARTRYVVYDGHSNAKATGLAAFRVLLAERGLEVTGKAEGAHLDEQIRGEPKVAGLLGPTPGGVVRGFTVILYYTARGSDVAAA